MSNSEASWTARRILSQLCDADRRREILTTFWKKAEQHDRITVAAKLARAMKFRDETVRKAPPEKKAEWLAARAALPELEEPLEIALMLYLASAKSEMLAAFLEAWNIPHSGGTIEAEEYRVPSAAEVERAVAELKERFDPADIRLYLAAAGLLMGGEWRAAAWPVVDSM